MIIHNATIHSPVERFATAMHIEGSTIVWLGDEDTAHYRSAAFPQAQLVDARRALITPSFHLTFTATPHADFHARGITAVHALMGADADAAELAQSLDLTPIHTTRPTAPEAIWLLPPGAAASEPAGLPAAGGGPTAAIALRTEEDVALLATDPTPRVYLAGHLTISPQDLLGREVVVILGPDVSVPLAGLARAGIPYAIAGEASPWELITRALLSGPDPISARAAFTAMTRGAWRLTPGQGAPRGVLRIGASADFAMWEVAALAVQAPDTESSAWSTDQRAGTPLLPALGEGETPPRLLRLVRAGTTVWSTPAG